MIFIYSLFLLHTKKVDDQITVGFFKVASPSVFVDITYTQTAWYLLQNTGITPRVNFIYNQNLCRPFSRTNYGLARFSVVASQTWKATPTKIKCLMPSQM